MCGNSFSALVKYIFVYMLIRSSLLTCSLLLYLYWFFFFFGLTVLLLTERSVLILTTVMDLCIFVFLFIFTLRQWDVHRFTILSSWWMNFLLIWNSFFKKENLKIYFLWYSLTKHFWLVFACSLFSFDYSVSLYLTCISFIWNICAYF